MGSRHPLADFVLGAFTDDDPCQDSKKIAYLLAGGVVHGKGSPFDAYVIVADDVLGTLVKGRELKIDEQGWFCRA